MSTMRVGRAGAFSRNHRRTHGVFGRAAGCERRAIRGPLQAFEHFGADAFGRLFGHQIAHAEDLLGIVARKFGTQAKTALRNDADAPPLAIGDFKHALDQALRGKVALVRHRADILIFGFGATLFQLRHQHVHGFQ
jgi:hypothetical protein